MTLTDYLTLVQAHLANRNPLHPSHPVGPVVCADGTRISVQASRVHYCSPRENVGPYFLVEVQTGHRVRSPDFRRADVDRKRETFTYGFVSVLAVARLIRRHGGFASHPAKATHQPPTPQEPLMPRTLAHIGADIRQHWKAPNYAAKPYLDALCEMDDVDANPFSVATGTFYFDSAKSVIRYFLSNATTWRGEEARQLKAELKGLMS